MECGSKRFSDTRNPYQNGSKRIALRMVGTGSGSPRVGLAHYYIMRVGVRFLGTLPVRTDTLSIVHLYRSLFRHL